MKIVEDIVERTLSNMGASERHDLILSVVEKMLSQMGSAERLTLMEHVVDHFLEGLPDAERQATVRKLVPRLLAQLMHSGGMNVDELLWAAMGSLGALEEGEAGARKEPTASGSHPKRGDGTDPGAGPRP
ncbi:MAG: hypothetical protein IVW55_02865 [Chloroflexi bacterium]|nr:hypothetical protein [Chloroflexota bacterium]